MNTLKIAFCTNGIFPHVVGGMQRHSKLLIDELSTYDDIEMVVFHPHEESIFPQQNVDEITVRGMDSSKNYLLERYRYSKRIYTQLQAFPEHIIYSQGPTVWYKAEEFESRLIINPHGLEPFQAITLREKSIGFPLRIVLRRLFKKARYVVSLGGRLTSILEPLVKSKNHLAILPNAVSEPPISADTAKIKINKPLKALFVGRFAANKGIHILMKTIDRLNEKGLADKIEFHLAGKGPLYEKYKASNNHNNVLLPGFVSDEELEDLYNSSDLFVLPTLFEGMPTVVLEAMGRALPIIVTDVGATAELVDSSNGFLIPKNDARQLTKTLIEFIQLPDSQKEQLGKRSLAKVREKFTWQQVAKMHLNLFKKLKNELETS